MEYAGVQPGLKPDSCIPVHKRRCLESKRTWWCLQLKETMSHDDMQPQLLDVRSRIERYGPSTRWYHWRQPVTSCYCHDRHQSLEFRSLSAIGKEGKWRQESGAASPSPSAPGAWSPGFGGRTSISTLHYLFERPVDSPNWNLREAGLEWRRGLKPFEG
ncbi:hypothetical protein BDV24DRAFT_101773 [Aspergillus arachidicola]|uniref:Uncharacterized protein n=1 Tax=Aspergillus arachidicola TaxID=656916 RepID=A0A5N6YQV5_9EURO|nr:hypothetical protein BDV24DRAFT_101773 [Aspergillus arachidicola]